MVNDEKKCQDSPCDGRMVLRGTQGAEDTLSPGAGFTIDLYVCSECGAEDWE